MCFNKIIKVLWLEIKIRVKHQGQQQAQATSLCSPFLPCNRAKDPASYILFLSLPTLLIGFSSLQAWLLKGKSAIHVLSLSCYYQRHIYIHTYIHMCSILYITYTQIQICMYIRVYAFYFPRFYFKSLGKQNRDKGTCPVSRVQNSFVHSGP